MFLDALALHDFASGSTPGVVFALLVRVCKGVDLHSVAEGGVPHSYLSIILECLNARAGHLQPLDLHNDANALTDFVSIE